jgi:hypothetical protein
LISEAMAMPSSKRGVVATADIEHEDIVHAGGFADEPVDNAERNQGGIC